MDEGYCVYFATTMVTMLRTQGIPARMTVGYTSGQRIDENQWVVRGLNSHAWVEVYFPDQGWVQFDRRRPGRARRSGSSVSRRRVRTNRHPLSATTTRSNSTRRPTRRHLPR